VTNCQSCLPLREAEPRCGTLTPDSATDTHAPDCQRGYSFPESLERKKILATSVYNPNLVRVSGYYGEGSKTIGFEIVEQLGWRLPTAVIAPMAGGSLLTELKKAFSEFLSAEMVSGATVAAAVQPAKRGTLTRDDEIIICIAGNGLKAPDAVSGVLPDSPIVDAKVR
jgi:threonine synthase